MLKSHTHTSYSRLAVVLLPSIAMTITLANAQALKTLTRNLEPVVRHADELLLDEFDGVPVDQIIAYKYTSTGNSWSRISFQIDQKAYRDLSNFIHCVPDYSPDCACEDPPTCEEVVCEETYIWEGENDPDDSGGTANVLDGNDELVFLAKDTGDQASTSNFPSGISILERYEIQVRDPDDLTTGYIYLFRLSSSQPPYSPGYMTYTRDPQTEEAVISGNCVNNLIGFDTYRVGLSSNWTVHELKTTTVADNGSGQALCTDFSQRTDVLDRYKWRMKIQTEETWNNTSSYMGDISGPVRIVRGSVGARSGYGTTRYTSAYPTFYKEEIHLRVHALEQGNIKTYHDYNTLSFTPGQETPCPGSDFEAYLSIPSDSHLDDVDGCPATFPTLDAYVSRQLN